MKILLLVDIQNDFCPGGALGVTEGDEVVEVANKLMNSGEFDLVIASQDFHPADHVSFADNHKGKKVFDTVEVEYKGEVITQTLWPRHCVQGTPGAELRADLDMAKIDLIVEKGTNSSIDSYSAFYDNMKLKETELLGVLKESVQAAGKELGEVELVVCGLATDYCVAATVRDARSLGLNTTLVIDGCRAVNLNPNDEINTLRDLIRREVNIVDSSSIVRHERSLDQEVSRGIAV